MATNGNRSRWSLNGIEWQRTYRACHSALFKSAHAIKGVARMPLYATLSAGYRFRYPRGKGGEKKWH